MQIFSNEYSWPFTSTGFISSNSTNHRWKTVSSQPQAQIPNCWSKTLSSIHSWLNLKFKGSTAESSYTQIFDWARVSVPTPALFKGQLHFKSTQVLDILNHLFSIFFHYSLLTYLSFPPAIYIFSRGQHLLICKLVPSHSSWAHVTKTMNYKRHTSWRARRPDPRTKV